MPTYEYRCDNCSRTFTVQMSIADHDRGAVTCPDCHRPQSIQQYSSFFPKTSKKS